MLLTSYEFLAFLLIAFVLYYLLPKHCQWVVLLAGSYVFYFLSGSWVHDGWEPRLGLYYVALLFAITLVTYITAIVLEQKNKKTSEYLRQHKQELSRDEKKAYRRKADHSKMWMMLAGLLVALGILAVFKYSDFAVKNVNSVFRRIGSGRRLSYPDLLVPMGISFYTFQSLGYLLDVYWEKVQAQKNLAKYMLFVSFFPQLIQGPISRYSDLEKSLYEKHSFDWKEVRFGAERVLWGFFKKLVVADTIAVAVDTISGDHYYKHAWIFVLLMFYAIQLYADFTGGIDITIGVAEIFGVRVQENFIRPYFSKNIAEYWRRWHISMGTWFRDYIFYPMSIAPWMTKFTKFCKEKLGKGIARRVPVYAATLVTWFATGLWHGAGWRYITWGVLNGVIILISGELEPLYQKFHKCFPRLTASRVYQGFQVLRTFLLMSSLRIFDCFTGTRYSMRMYKNMLLHFDVRQLTREEFSYLGLETWQYIAVGCGVLLMFAVSMAQRSGSVREKIAAWPYVVRFACFALLFFAVLLFGSYGVGYDASQFIYNQF